MRYTILLSNISNLPTPSLSNENTYHIHDVNIYKKHLLLSIMYNKDKFFRDFYKRIFVLAHPFETISSYIRSELCASDQNIKITNAFMKMYEFLEMIDEHIPNTGTLTMYDVAGAPGMFVLAMEYYLKIKRNSKVTLDWYACSLIDDDNALTDTYGLYSANPQRFTPCNVLVENDISKCISARHNQKYHLVTGDIGIYHDDDYSKLQEEIHLDLQWGQMILALNLVEESGIMYLKMYTYVTEESHYLLDVLTYFFDKVYITKPYTSRVINTESYIVCINRNNKRVNLPLSRPRIEGYKSININLINTFENTRADYKVQLISLLIRLLKADKSLSFADLKHNHSYAIFWNQLKSLMLTFSNISPQRTTINNNTFTPDEEIEQLKNIMNTFTYRLPHSSD